MCLVSPFPYCHKSVFLFHICNRLFIFTYCSPQTIGHINERYTALFYLYVKHVHHQHLSWFATLLSALHPMKYVPCSVSCPWMSEHHFQDVVLPVSLWVVDTKLGVESSGCTAHIPISLWVVDTKLWVERKLRPHQRCGISVECLESYQGLNRAVWRMINSAS